MIEIFRVKNNEQMNIVSSICREVFADELCLSVKTVMDKDDKDSINVLAFVNGEPAGCGRLLPMGEYAIIENVAVRRSFRRIGIGTGICKLLIALAEETIAKKACLKAQPDIAEFFTRLGFEISNVPDDVQEITMTRKV